MCAGDEGIVDSMGADVTVMIDATLVLVKEIKCEKFTELTYLTQLNGQSNRPAVDNARQKGSSTLTGPSSQY